MAGTGKAAGAGKRTTSGKVVTTHKNTAGKGTVSKSRNRTRGAAQSKSRPKSVEDMQAYQDHLAFETGITICVISIIAIFLYLSYFQLAGKTGMVVGGLFFGVFGWFAWLLPLFCLIGFVFCIVNRGDKRVIRRISSFSGIVLALLGLSDLIFQRQIITEYYTSNHVLHKDYFECMSLTCKNVVEHGKFNGGLCGRAISAVFSMIIGKIGAGIILFALLLFCIYIFYGVEMMGMLRKRNAYRREMEEVYEELRKEEAYEEPSYRVFTNTRTLSGSRQMSESSLPKAPKVQSFDLRKMDASRKKEKDRPAFETKEKQGAMPEIRQETKKAAVKAAEEVKPAEDVTGSREILPSAEDRIQETYAVPEIPIYRNELNEKFGRKRKKDSAVPPKTVMSAEQSVIQTDAEQRHQPIQVPEKPEPESVVKPESETAVKPEPETAVKPEPETAVKPESESVMESETEHMQQPEKSVSEEKLQDSVPEKSEPEKSEPAQEQKYSALENAAGTGRTEDVGEITEEKQKALAEASEYRKPVLDNRAAKPQKSMSSHGKIGGEDYVSASDTFNALNESKVSAEEGKPYEVPPLELLALPKEAEDRVSDEQLRMTASKLQDTLKSFNVNVTMGPVTCGPTVTRYELFPEQGVRVNKITNLADDLKLSLAAASIRIEAPIPGKAAVGIEVPNPTPSSVYFRELLEGDAFAEAKSDLTFAVGKDIAGKLIMADITKMPHLLIAGATGSGKSVCINTLIMSILYKADPKDVKLIMIDPKVVELSVYNGIPHLFCPVVTDPKEAAAALNWAVREMMDRYNKFKELGVRNISGYNAKIKEFGEVQSAGYTKMPYLIVIVDEFADLMMVASKEVEDAVCRLAQLARAAGIHLVLATQRPSVNVITGVIKANIPSRIAFSVSSVIDSRTILDKGGAEKLLGKGDMLFFPSGYSEPVRVQGAFVADKEVSDVVDFLRSNNETPEYNHTVTEIMEEPKEAQASEEKKSQDDRDEYFEEAGRFVIESDRAAAGQLQRRFSIGFNRAGRIIDQLHKAGVVGPAEGTKPRKVLMTMEEFECMLSGAAETVSQEEMESMVKEMEEEAVVTQEMNLF